MTFLNPCGAVGICIATISSSEMLWSNEEEYQSLELWVRKSNLDLFSGAVEI